MVAKKTVLAGACFGYRISFVDFWSRLVWRTDKGRQTQLLSMHVGIFSSMHSWERVQVGRSPLSISRIRRDKPVPFGRSMDREAM
jgi:hypothetical protein